jgi:hypothetical protein
MMPAIDWSKVLPIIISMLVIIAVAVLRKYSPTFASIAAVMPINIPLAIAIVYAGTPPAEQQATMPTFTSGLAINLMPTFLFTIVVWRMFAMGYGLWAALIVGYIIWAIGLALLFLLRAWLKF